MSTLINLNSSTGVHSPTSVLTSAASTDAGLSTKPLEDESPNTDQKLLSIILTGNKLGSAYYDVETNVVYIMKDIVEGTNFVTLKDALIQISPTTVITSSKQKEDFVDIIHKLGQNDENSLQSKWNVEILPGNVFSYEICKRRILSMNGLPGLREDMSDNDRNIYFSSRVPFENYSMVCALGSLLKYLDQIRPGVELEHDTPVPILFIQTLSLDNIMTIDEYTYSALQIFHKESHPSVFKTGGGKEGLSLFGVMNYTKSKHGHTMLRNWFQRPNRDKHVLEKRQNAISYFVNPRSIEALVTLQDCLKNTKNVMRILAKMKSSGISLYDWQHLYKTIFNAICISDVCKGLSTEVYIVEEINKAFSKELLSMGNLIKHIVDFEESNYLHHFVVKPGVDETLDEKKRTFDGIPFLMTKVAQEELSKLNSSITKCSVTYLPQLGYLLNIPLTDEMKRTGNYNVDDNLEFKFTAEDLVYYKSAGTTDLDQKLGDIQCDIRDQETAIMHRLQDTILEYVEVFHNVTNLSAELDCILALTTAAKELNFNCPKLLEQAADVLKITGGRHPLQEMCVSQFVVNDTDISIETGKMKILTGPNASGKSVYLKQVGLIVYLAHIGSFVPAESAEISVKDAIFTRIHSRETVSVQLSTFMIDLNQIVTALVNATDNSLVIIDEFGKGTSAVDGLALLSAVLLSWLDENNEHPIVLASTHFHRIKNFITESNMVTYQTMDVIRTDDEVVFLYQLKDGYVDYSYASHVAKSVSIPDHIIARSNEVSDCILKKQPITRNFTPDAQREHKRNLKIADDFLALDLDRDDIEHFLNGIVADS